jgi:hypothetical protein
MAMAHQDRQSSAAAHYSEPYPGQSSFELEDAAVFFGRSAEADALRERILAARITVLHATSGAGKTSLLNARIIPSLEADGWFAVRIKPGDNPIQAVKHTVIQYLFPPPEAEAAALLRLLTALEPSSGSNLAALLDTAAARLKTDPSIRFLLGPVQAGEVMPHSTGFESVHGILTDFDHVRPAMCRVLAGSTPLATVERSWHTLARGAGCAESLATERLDDVIACLRSPRFIAAYRELVASLYVPVPGLLAFFERLCEHCREVWPAFGLVLVFDQFEELFTRFSDPGRMAPRAADDQRLDDHQHADWRVRAQFFAELETLVASSFRVTADPGGPDTTQLPLRYVLSLRDEYVARLNPVRQFAPDLDESSYRLQFLTLEQARDAITAPARMYNCAVDIECVSGILDELKLEDAFVEPGPLQIVCQKLWANRAHGAVSTISGVTLKTVGGVRAILETFFADVLRRLTADLAGRHFAETEHGPDTLEQFVRLEVLDLLAKLLTPSRTRNVVERIHLVRAPHRRVDLRETILSELERYRIVRKESRLGTEFYEITHEFLVQPILDELNRDRQFADLDRSLFALTVRVEGDPYEPLPRPLFAVLDRSRRLLVWGPVTEELMFRNAVFHGLGGESLSYWHAQVQGLHARVSPDEVRRSVRGSRKLCRFELALVAGMTGCSPEVKAQAIRGLLSGCGPVDVTLLTMILQQEAV